MSGVGFIGWILIGIAAGFVAEKVMKVDHGLITNLIVGVVGAFLGGFIANLLGVNFYGWLGSFVVASIGAIVLLYGMKIFRSKS